MVPVLSLTVNGVQGYDYGIMDIDKERGYKHKNKNLHHHDHNHHGHDHGHYGWHDHNDGHNHHHHHWYDGDKNGQRDCAAEPSMVENGEYHCSRAYGSFVTWCTLYCNDDHLGNDYEPEDQLSAVLQCNSDDEWRDVNGNGAPATKCVPVDNTCPTDKDAVAAIFPTGDGGEWLVNVIGVDVIGGHWMTDITLMCGEFNGEPTRPADNERVIIHCDHGNWDLSPTICIPDIDYCETDHPKDMENSVVHGNWDCTYELHVPLHVEMYKVYPNWACHLTCDYDYIPPIIHTAECKNTADGGWPDALPMCSEPAPCAKPEDDSCTTWNCHIDYLSDHALGHLFLQQVQTCISTCSSGCANPKSSVYHCDVKTGLWDMAPVRCCPDVHEIFVESDGDGLCDAIPSGTPFAISAPETWLGDALGDDRSTYTDHGSYTCSELEDVQVPYINPLTGIGRRRRAERHWPTNPPWTTGLGKTCTLTCPGDEVPVNGEWEAKCQIAYGTHTWTSRITKCVEPELIKANLVLPSSNTNPLLNPGGSWTQPAKPPANQPPATPPISTPITQLPTPESANNPKKKGDKKTDKANKKKDKELKKSEKKKVKDNKKKDKKSKKSDKKDKKNKKKDRKEAARAL